VIRSNLVATCLSAATNRVIATTTRLQPCGSDSHAVAVAGHDVIAVAVGDTSLAEIEVFDRVLATMASNLTADLR